MLRKLFLLLPMLLIVMAPMWGLTQEASTTSTTLAESAPAEVIVAPSGAEWEALVNMLGGLKGASTMLIVAAIIQALFLAFRTKLGEMAGKYRLAILTLLTLVGVTLSLVASGQTWPQAIANAFASSTFQVYFHQAFKQFFTPKGDVA